ncbi:restriction endonuclease subunit S [Blautia producta]|jgi:type I restriction enzyme S subunit|uniref:restriction endonuclease subunit S n=1 Tax=Blautia producta TaxID=33035 RepID=UPI00210D6B38|nr:restriction endonuclease subunit S [Blautia producta]MCH4242370.1 restriction endonuclease subunit S [Prevotella sp.]MCQ5126778.1 restriction endonuclease subunit S [Blautia producta]
MGVRDWAERPVGELMIIETGSRNTEDKIDDGQYPFFVRSQTVEHIDDYHYDCEAVLTAGDGVGTGKVFHYIKGKFDAHQRVYVMSQFKDVMGKYFYYWFSRNFYNEVAKYTAKTSVDSVRRQMITGMIMPVPPILEQEKIVNALSDIDTLITGLQKLIQKKKNIRQGTMQMLLTGKKRLNGYSGDWVKINLAKNSKLKARIGWQGLTTAEYLDEGYSYLITGTDFQDGQINWNGCHFVNYDRYTQDSNIQVSNGDLLLTKDGTIGKVAYVTDLKRPATLNSGVFLVKPITDAYVAHFMFYVLESLVFKDFLQQLSAGSTINHLYQKDLVKFDLYVPPTKEEQEAIAAILFDMDSDIYKLEEKLSKYQKIKQGMMEELLTGKVRLS